MKYIEVRDNKKRRQFKKSLKQEGEAMKMTKDCPYIVDFYGSFGPVSEGGNDRNKKEHYVLVLEYCQSDLQEKESSLTVKSFLKYFTESLLGLKYLHHM